MKIKCEYCSNYIDDSEEKCPGCGAVNKNYKRVANEVPKTIEELQKWYDEHNLPPSEVTRFFIGVDYKASKAFGIYKDQNSGKFIVYKNKDTGERKIRYEGLDEGYAVNELYLKLKEEIINQKSLNAEKRGKKAASASFSKIIFISFILLIIYAQISSYFAPSRGYYYINDENYYYVKGMWYVYKDNDWTRASKPKYSGNVNDYYKGYSPSAGDYTDIKESSVYNDSWDSSRSSSGDWDSSSSWSSSDSWDSGGTDWSSDW